MADVVATNAECVESYLSPSKVEVSTYKLASPHGPKRSRVAFSPPKKGR